MQKRKFSIIAHFIAWLFFLGLPFGFIYEDKDLQVKIMLFSPYYWLFSLSYGLLFYLNFFNLIPRLYLKKQHGRYMLTLFFLFMIFYFLKPFYRMFEYYITAKGLKVTPTTLLKIDTLSCILFIVVICSGTAIQVVREWRATERRALQAETEKANAELSFLKAQINPHFLYNTLNNIYSLSIDRHPDTSDSILKLSCIMRYITDEATKDLVCLEQEIACIRDYIDLQQLRLNTNMKLDLTIAGSPEHKQVVPLILITYIENAFKYGISSHEKAMITIRLDINEDEITLFCRNKIFSGNQGSESTGIGLANTKKRLFHLYQGQHQAAISLGDGYYTVEQTLPLKDQTNKRPRSRVLETVMELEKGYRSQPVNDPGITLPVH